MKTIPCFEKIIETRSQKKEKGTFYFSANHCHASGVTLMSSGR